MARIQSLTRQTQLPSQTGVPSPRPVTIQDTTGVGLQKFGDVIQNVGQNLLTFQSEREATEATKNAILKTNELIKKMDTGEYLSWEENIPSATPPTINDLQQRLETIYASNSDGLSPAALNKFQKDFSSLSAKTEITIKTNAITKLNEKLLGEALKSLDDIHEIFKTTENTTTYLPLELDNSNNFKELVSLGVLEINSLVKNRIITAPKGEELKSSFKNKMKTTFGNNSYSNFFSEANEQLNSIDRLTTTSDIKNLLEKLKTSGEFVVSSEVISEADLTKLLIKHEKLLNTKLIKEKQNSLILLTENYNPNSGLTVKNFSSLIINDLVNRNVNRTVTKEDLDIYNSLSSSEKREVRKKIFGAGTDLEQQQLDMKETEKQVEDEIFKNTQDKILNPNSDLSDEGNLLEEIRNVNLPATGNVSRQALINFFYKIKNNRVNKNSEPTKKHNELYVRLMERTALPTNDPNYLDEAGVRKLIQLGDDYPLPISGNSNINLQTVLDHATKRDNLNNARLKETKETLGRILKKRLQQNEEGERTPAGDALYEQAFAMLNQQITESLKTKSVEDVLKDPKFKTNSVEQQQYLDYWNNKIKSRIERMLDVRDKFSNPIGTAPLNVPFDNFKKKLKFMMSRDPKTGNLNFPNYAEMAAKYLGSPEVFGRPISVEAAKNYIESFFPD